MKNRYKLIFAVAAMIALLFSACEGPEGPPGLPGEEGTIPPQGQLVVNINADNTEIVLQYGTPTQLTATMSPSNATIQLLTWSLYDEVSREVVSLSRPGSASASHILSGNSVEVNALSGGEAKILISAIGSGGTPVTSTVTVTVPSVVNNLDTLRRMEATELPATELIQTVLAEDFVRPQVLYFDGEEIEITIRGTGSVLTLHGTGAMFRVGYGVTLILEGVELHGANPNTGGTLIVVEEGGTLKMDAGAKITGNASSIPSTVLNLPLQGGAVRVNHGGTFYLLDGEISGNIAMGQGAGVMNFGNFIMENGVIFQNVAWGTATGVNVSGGAGVSNHGNFTMKDGIIFNNTVRAATLPTPIGQGGGVFNALPTSVFIMEDGVIIDNWAGVGGGVQNLGIFEMHGGEITDNRARGLGGGGVNNELAFLMENGTIHDNFSYGDGGGVRNMNLFIMEDGVINDNTAPFGGGIANRFLLQMSGGNITGNNATGHSQSAGGGVCNWGSFFSMLGGEISGNSAIVTGGGLDNLQGTFRMVTGVIYGNEAEEVRANTALLGSALFSDGSIATAQRGTIDNDGDFEWVGNLFTGHLTVRVLNGDFAIAPDPSPNPNPSLKSFGTHRHSVFETLVLPEGLELPSPSLNRASQ